MYMLYDTALNGLYSLNLLQKAYTANHSLFKGTKDEHLFDVAPYLFTIDDRFFYNLTDPHISLKAIVAIETSMADTVLLSHLQQFIYQQQDGRQQYYRFWDARVLVRFLTGNTYDQLAPFFDEINNFYVPDLEKVAANRYTLKRGKLQIDNISLDRLFFLGNDLQEIQTATEVNKQQKNDRTFFK